MARKQIHIPRGSLFTGLLILALILQILPQDLTNHVNLVYSGFFAPILNVGFNRTSLNFYHPDDTESVPVGEYNRMRTALEAALENERARLMELKRRFDALARIKHGLPEPGPITREAQVQTRIINGTRRELILNRGEKDYVQKGQYVLGEHCVIGTVAETTRQTSRVRLVTDAGHRIEIAIWRKGNTEYIPGQLVGTGEDLCKIPLISREYDVRENDVVYAAARPGFLETPTVIGYITAVGPDENNPLLLDITVKPLFDPANLSLVAIILMDEGPES